MMNEASQHKELINDFYHILEKHGDEFNTLSQWMRFNLFCSMADTICTGDKTLAKSFARDYLKMKFNEDKTEFNGPGFVDKATNKILLNKEV